MPIKVEPLEGTITAGMREGQSMIEHPTRREVFAAAALTGLCANSALWRELNADDELEDEEAREIAIAGIAVGIADQLDRQLRFIPPPAPPEAR